MEIINIISGPIIGAIIGYSTNYLAVKMLFRPYKEKRIGKVKIPFTPGIIPKRRYELAKAIGDAVKNKLLTNEDLSNELTKSGSKDKILGSLMMKLYSSNSINDELKELNINSEDAISSISLFISKKLVNGLLSIDIENKIVDFGMNYFNEKRNSLGMLAMFIKDDMVEGILNEIAKGIRTKVEESGIEFVNPYVVNELNKTANTPLNELTISLDKNKIYEIIKKVYDLLLKEVFESFASSIDISKMIENKINEMDMKELEKLILTVMKKELNAIVNLGAVLGFLIGIINIFI